MHVPPKHNVEKQSFQKANSPVQMDDVKSLTHRLLDILEKEPGSPSTASQQNLRFAHANPTILKPLDKPKQEQNHSYNKLYNRYDKPQDRRFSSSSYQDSW